MLVMTEAYTFLYDFDEVVVAVTENTTTYSYLGWVVVTSLLTASHEVCYIVNFRLDYTQVDDVT